MHLARQEAQHLDGGKLALALGDVGVREREHDGERQRRRKDDDHIDHRVDKREGRREVAHELGRRGDGEQARIVCERVAELDLGGIVTGKGGEQAVLLGRLAKARPIS